MSNAGKALVVCKSVHHGNTARVAEAIASALNADCVAPEACPYERLATEFARAMRCLQALFVWAVLLVRASNASEPATDDRVSSIGVWNVVAVEINGKRVDDELVSLLRVSYRHDGSWTVLFKGIVTIRKPHE